MYLEVSRARVSTHSESHVFVYAAIVTPGRRGWSAQKVQIFRIQLCGYAKKGRVTAHLGPSDASVRTGLQAFPSHSSLPAFVHSDRCLFLEQRPAARRGVE
jgi:hypothetical protein